MIFIVSEDNDATTDLVIDWLRFFEIENIVRVNKEEPNDWLSTFAKITCVILYESPKIATTHHKQGTIIYLKEAVKSGDNCGVISKETFTCNSRLFTESQQYNTCLNRKVSIDEQGNIKNCPSMKKHYGNIKDTCINDVIATKEFQKLWHIKKDDVKVCNDCEFRHMCTDCRVFLKDSNDLHSQPAKCDYNPYIAKWKGEERYEPVEKWQLANQ